MAMPKQFAPEAYEFLCQALGRAQELVARERGIPLHRSSPEPAEEPIGEDVEEPAREVFHVSGQELLAGIRDLATEQFGMMAAVVLRCWGIEKTDDFGAMVYALIDAGIWHKQPTDRIEDFADGYDFDQVFVRDFSLEWDRE